MDSSPDFELRLDDWLDAVKWEYLPFANPRSPTNPVTRAEDEKTYLMEYFTDSIEHGWPAQSPSKIVDRAIDQRTINQLCEDAHAVVFGHEGEGKTAYREIATQLSHKDRHVIIPYLEFGASVRTADEHAEAILRLLQDQFQDSLRRPVSELSPLKQLGTVVQEIVSNGGVRRSVFLFVDNADYELPNDGTAADLERFIAPLFTPGFMLIPGLWLKLFLPLDLASYIREYRIVHSRRIAMRPFHIKWTEKRLTNYLSSRIETVNTQSHQLQAITKEWEFSDLDSELVQRALDQPGAPRYLNILVYEMIRARIDSREPRQFLLTREDLQTAMEKAPYVTPFSQKHSSTGRSVHTVPEPNQHSLLSSSVLIVTSTEVEATSVLDVFSGVTGTPWKRRPIGNKTYYNLGNHGGTIVYMVQSEVGSATPGGSLLTVRQAIGDLQPQAVIMCGIAFGLHPDEQELGEILVASKLQSYEPQKMDQRRGLLQRGDRVTSSIRLLDRFRSGYKDWTGAKVYFQLVLSGEKLVNDPDFRNNLLEIAPEAAGGEMEGTGLYVAAHDAKVDWILAKAICDWADGMKTSEFQEQAARAAAQFVLHVVQLGLSDGEGSSKVEGPELPQNTEPSIDPAPMTILFLSANPTDTSRIRCDEEFREIDEALGRTRNRDKFQVIPKLAVRDSDIRRAMLATRPTIVHFCGHGSGQQGILFEDTSGKAISAETRTLSEFFGLFKETVNCVLLNACYSESQAEAIAEHIDYVIGTHEEIANETAIGFAVAFYDALAEEKSIEESFVIARNAIGWQRHEGVQLPVLKTKKSAAARGH